MISIFIVVIKFESLVLGYVIMYELVWSFPKYLYRGKSKNIKMFVK